jgi:hypothetical protein
MQKHAGSKQTRQNDTGLTDRHTRALKKRKGRKEQEIKV